MRKNRFSHVTVTALALAAALASAPAASAYFAGGGKDAEKGNDCLIGFDSFFDASDVTLDGKKQIVECTDCDPACDTDGVAEANGSCTFDVGVCVNQSGVEGCTPPAALDKATAKGKVKGVKGAEGKIVIDATQLLTGSGCGAHVDAIVPTLEKKGEPTNGEVGLQLSGSTKKNKPEGLKARKDKDKVKVRCLPRPVGEACPIATPVCGDGAVTGTEECDITAEPSGCGAGLTCVAGCTCEDCVPPGKGEPTSLTFTTALGTDNCGPVALGTPPNAPFGGELLDSGNTQITPLGLGCLYIGGGSSTVPGGITPDTAPNTYDIDLACNGGDELQLVGSAGTSVKDCSLAAGPTRVCANGHPGTDTNGLCTVDADCRPLCVDNLCANGAPGTDGNGACVGASNCGSGAEGCLEPGCTGLVCVPVPNCYFGPPLPVKNGALSTCVGNVFITDGGGTANTDTGDVALTIPLSSRVHFTGTRYPGNPCPTCQAGVCNAGPNVGLTCTGVGLDGTTHDCPPDPFTFLAPLAVTLSPLTTGTSTLPTDGTVSPDGLFCPGQLVAGAFAVDPARKISMTGTPVTAPIDTTAKAAVLASAFCIPVTGNLLIDGAADLPGPGATSLAGTVQLQ